MSQYKLESYIITEADIPPEADLSSPMCAVKANGTANNLIALITVMTAIGVLLLIIVATTAYFCWKKRMKVQEVICAENSNLRSWSHCHDHEHQQPTTDVIISSEVIVGLYNGFMFIIQILTKNIYSSLLKDKQQFYKYQRIIMKRIVISWKNNS